jgi:excisionase family DNA binding protein
MLYRAPARRKTMPKAQARTPAAPIAIGEGEFITCKQAANLLKLSEISVRRLLTKKKLRRYKVGARTLIRASEVAGLVREA